MEPRDFRCAFCGSVTRTTDRVPIWREFYTVCPGCGCSEVHDWNPNKYRWRNVLRASFKMHHKKRTGARFINRYSQFAKKKKRYVVHREVTQ